MCVFEGEFNRQVSVCLCEYVMRGHWSLPHLTLVNLDPTDI